ncbi:hypothetical protein F2Q68_00011829 [Brassica cretica]|uniref:Uncharacterized protein n=1 Tax=Brassica cretica TaxID=69181 RepID=A0A8S9KY14_BRACR|nr:hypothetical protein F2Q68_00011829 [Brassica cretica]
MRKPVGKCFVLTRSLSNSRKAVLFPPPCRSNRRNDPAKLKRMILKWSDVTPTNTTMPKSSSSSTSKQQLGSSSKEEDARNDEAQSEIPT